jgi:predicted lactoylglutathione lyase
MIISNDICVMLLVEPFFQSFTKKDIVDTKKAQECIIYLSAESKANVDDIINKAVEAGAIPKSRNDYDWMYQHSFEDLDGHIWEYGWMDPAGPPKQ